jgi:hypothetical protein
MFALLSLVILRVSERCSMSLTGYIEREVKSLKHVLPSIHYKSRLVSYRHITDIQLDLVFSGVVSIRGFRFFLLLAELDNLELWATDSGNAYVKNPRFDLRTKPF